MRSALRFPDPGEIKLGGYGGEIINYTIENQLLDVDTWSLLVNQFRLMEDGINKGWRGEYWGKMMRGAALTYRATKNEKLYTVLKESVLDMLTTQEPSGRFSTYTTDTEFHAWDMWARKYVMLGMMYFLDICKSKSLSSKIITAMKKHADYIIAHIGEGRGKKSIFDTAEHIGSMNSCSILEPFVRLYNLTGKHKYLDFATYLVKSGLCKGADLVDLALKKELYPYQYPQTKAYEMMSCFEGVLEYYKTVGNPDHLLAVENFVDMLIASDYTLIGGAGCRHEFLDNSTLTQTEPATMDVMQETCVTVTLIKLCAKLLAVTGKAKYAEYIERSGLNAMYGTVNNRNQKMTRTLARTWLKGGQMIILEDHEAFPFDSYSPLYNDRRGLRCGGVQLLQNGRSYGCCVCIGSAGTAIMGLFAVMKGKDGIYVNLFNDCKFATADFGEPVRLTMRANPYESNGAKISIDGKGQRFAVALRIPTWANKFTVFVNSERVDAHERDGYLVIEREWRTDKIDVRFTASVTMRVIGGKLAFTKGPIALATDTRHRDSSSPIDLKPKDGKAVRARRVRNTAFDTNVTFEIPTQEGSITLCDYAEAGKNYDEENTGLTVWHKVK